MNKNAKKWVEVLRSDEYKQTKGKLNDGRGAFCVLGVACDLYRQEHATETWKWGKVEIPSDGSPFTGPDVYMTCEVPDEVRDWLGLYGNSGEYETKDSWDKLHSLVDDNDVAELSFKELADIIESEPKGMFKNSRKKKRG